MMNVLPNFDLNSPARRRPPARRHPERSRFSGEARDLPRSNSAIGSADKPATNCATEHWPLATANWTNP